MSDLPVIADGWDEAKCIIHLADLEAELSRFEHTAEAMRDAADEWERMASQRRSQIRYCTETFAKPKPTTTTSPSDGAREESS